MCFLYCYYCYLSYRIFFKVCNGWNYGKYFLIENCLRLCGLHHLRQFAKAEFSVRSINHLKKRKSERDVLSCNGGAAEKQINSDAAKDA